jgi:hypothetical protein
MAQDHEPIAKARETLFASHSGSAPDPAYIEQYKLYLELLDKVSERRQSANSFFLSINTGLCALLGYMFSKDASPELRFFGLFRPREFFYHTFGFDSFGPTGISILPNS